MTQSEEAIPSLTPCEQYCQVEQSALVACVASLRPDSARHSSNPQGGITPTKHTDTCTSYDDDSTKKESCLQPAITAWTLCCSRANMTQD